MFGKIFKTKDNSPLAIVADLKKRGYDVKLAQLGAAVRFDSNALLLVDGICLAEFEPKELDLEKNRREIFLLGFDTCVPVVSKEYGIKMIQAARKSPGLKIVA